MTDNERLFRIVRPDGCWHEVVNYCHCTCGFDGISHSNAEYHCKTSNPTFPHSDEIATAMMEAGLWEEFVEFNAHNSHFEEFDEDGYFVYGYHYWLGLSASAEILVTPELLKRAIIAWREGK